MLDWEENLFVGLKAVYRRLVTRPRSRRREQVAARLSERRHALLLLAQMVSGRGLKVFESDEPSLCRDERLFLPTEWAIARSKEGNAALYELKALFGGLAFRDRWPEGALSLEFLLRRYGPEFPGLGDKVASIQGQLGEGTSLAAAIGVVPGPNGGIGLAGTELASASQSEPSAERVTTEVEGKSASEVTVLPYRDDDGVGADMPMHTFEKVEAPEEYNGSSRKSDDADELHEHAEGLSEVNMTQVMRSPERPRSIYRSEMIMDGLAGEVSSDSEDDGIPYPEWDHRRSAHRPDWCRVLQERMSDVSGEWSAWAEVKHRRLIRQLRTQFAGLHCQWLRRRRQPFGDDFDMDAVVDSEVERRTGHVPTEAIYIERRRDVHDVAALILLDESYSTDAWIEGRRVLDVIRESVFCAGEVLEADIESFAVAAFSSNTRRSCRFKIVKGFRDTWVRARNRLGGLESRGYTRIGPALRHAQELLMAERTSRKIVILLTDGRPCDYDRYEGTYGIKDVKKAIETGRVNGIHTHAFAVEKQAAEFFPRMFTKHDFDILPHPDRLARTMCRLFGRLLSS